MASVEFPLAARELTKSGRAKSTYFIRAFVVGTILLFAFGLTTASTARAGSNLVYLVMWCQMMACFVLPVALTAESIAGEKRDQTLQFLILADRKGHQVLAAKFLAAFLHVELVLVSALPMFAIVAFLGGVDVPVLATRLAMMTLFAAVGCMIGLLASTLAAKPLSALTRGLVMVFFWQAPTAWVDLYVAGATMPYPLSPTCAVGCIGDPRKTLVSFLPCIGLTFFLGILATVLALYLLPRQVHGKSKASTRSRRTWRRRVLQEGLLLNSPAAHIVAYAAAGWFARIPRTVGRLVATVLLLAIAFVPFAGWAVVLLLLHYDVVSSFRELRRSLTIDELELTPITPSRLSSAIVRGTMYRCSPYFLAVAAMGLPTLLVIITSDKPEILAIEGTLWQVVATVLIVLCLVAYALCFFYFTVGFACTLASNLRRVNSAVLATAGLLATFWVLLGSYVLCGVALSIVMKVRPNNELAFWVPAAALLGLLGAAYFYLGLGKMCQDNLTTSLRRFRRL